MHENEDSILKIYASTTDKIGGKLLYEHIVHLAKEQGLTGVTVYRGIMGFGSSSKNVSSSKFWELTDKLPVMIEMVDKREVLLDFYKLVESDLENTPKGCLVTLEPVEIKLLKAGKQRG